MGMSFEANLVVAISTIAGCFLLGAMTQTPVLTSLLVAAIATPVALCVARDLGQ